MVQIRYPYFAYDESSGFPMEQNLSITTVQSFWNDIDTNAKDKVTAAYDRVKSKSSGSIQRTEKLF